MKKIQEMIGLPIIDISVGNEVGKVKGIIINATSGRIDYLIVDCGLHSLRSKVILTDNIIGIGEFALTIENESHIKDINDMPQAIELLHKNIHVVGTGILTKKGNLIGKAGEIVINEDNCDIAGIELISEKKSGEFMLIPRECILTYGEKLLIVSEDAIIKLVENFGTVLLETQSKDEVISESLKSSGSSESLKSSGSPESSDFQSGQELLNQTDCYVGEKENNTVDVANSNIYVGKKPNDGKLLKKSLVSQEVVTENTDINIVKQTVIIKYIKDSFENTVSNPSYTETSENKSKYISNASKLFEQRQRQYLFGRKVTKTIADSTGNVIISEGVIICDEIINIAKEYGKLTELVMNNR